jgi:hypothetical protein
MGSSGLPRSTSPSVSSGSSPVVWLYAGAVYLIIACARKPPMRNHYPHPEAMDSLAIRRMPWSRTFKNYFDASYLAGTRTELAERIRYTSIAHASLCAFFEGVEAHPAIQSSYRQDDGAFDWLDKASDHWRAQRQAKLK